MEIQNYENVNEALKRIAELSVGIERINGEVTLECNRIKESRSSEIEKLCNEKKYLEQCITSFCEENKVREKIDKLILALKSYGCSDCIKYEESIDKEAVCELDDSTLVKLGLKRVVKDNFRIVPKIESLENAQ